MTKDTSDIQQRFSKKASKKAPSLTEEERLRKTKKLIKTLDDSALEAQENGLTEELGEQILEELRKERIEQGEK